MPFSDLLETQAQPATQLEVTHWFCYITYVRPPCETSLCAASFCCSVRFGRNALNFETKPVFFVVFFANTLNSIARHKGPAKTSVFENKARRLSETEVALNETV